MSYTDLELKQDHEGIFDLSIENGDFKTVSGLETALAVSLFSDRRAYVDEVPDPLERRGWIGDLFSEHNGDIHGSGLWFYMQSRSLKENENGIKSESRQALEWLITDGLAGFVDVTTDVSHQKRRLTLNITITALNGGVSSHAFDIGQATKTGTLIR